MGHRSLPVPIVCPASGSLPHARPSTLEKLFAVKISSLALLFLSCLACAQGQARGGKFSGGQVLFNSGGFSAYTGEIVVNPPAAYSLGGTTKNGNTTTDTTYPSGNPATVFRCTDVNMTPGKTTVPGYNAGEGGSGAADLVSPDDYALRLEGSSGYYFITLFNPNTLVCGDPTTGNVITQDKNIASPGSSSSVEAFGGGTFGQGTPGIYTVVGQTTRSTSATQITQYTINTHGGATSTWGQFTWAPLADAINALPINPAAWTASTRYAYGAPVTYAMTSGQLVTYPTPPSTITPNVGDLVQPASGFSPTTAFKAITVTGPTSGSTPNWNSVCSGTQIGSITDGGVVWKGIGGPAVFVYQNTGTAGTSGSSTPSFVPASNHPTLLTTATDSGGIVWTNICPAVSPTWQSWGGSGLNSLVPSEALSTCTYGVHQSQNITGIAVSGGTATISWAGTSFLKAGPATISGASVSACNGSVTLLTANANTATFSAGSCTASTGGLAAGDVFTTNGDQGSGIFAVEWDGNLNVYHTFNTATLIQTDNLCSTGPAGGGVSCTGGSFSSTAHGPLTGTACTAFIHNVKSRYGQYVIVAKQGTLGPATCANGSYVWRAQQTPFAASSQVSELPFQPNHWDDMRNNFFAVTVAGYPANVSGYGSFAVKEPLGTLPFAFPPPTVWANFPCSTSSAPYTSIPPCQEQTYVDSHLSCAYNPGMTDTWPCMGTMYNLLTLDIKPFMAWQGEEIGVSTTPVIPYSSFPVAAPIGNTVYRFGHTSNWNTSGTFSAQFAISEVAPSGNFIFFTTDNQGTFGSITGSSPTVCSGACTNGQLAVAAVPASPSCVGGPVWEPNHNYVVGNIVIPITAGNAGSGGTLDIFQVVSVGSSGGVSGATQPSGFVSASFTTPTPTQVTENAGVNQVVWQDIYTAPGANGGSLCRNEVLGMKLPH